VAVLLLLEKMLAYELATKNCHCLPLEAGIVFVTCMYARLLVDLSVCLAVSVSNSLCVQPLVLKFAKFSVRVYPWQRGLPPVPMRLCNSGLR